MTSASSQKSDWSRCLHVSIVTVLVLVFVLLLVFFLSHGWFKFSNSAWSENFRDPKSEEKGLKRSEIQRDSEDETQRNSLTETFQGSVEEASRESEKLPLSLPISDSLTRESEIGGLKGSETKGRQDSKDSYVSDSLEDSDSETTEDEHGEYLEQSPPTEASLSTAEEKPSSENRSAGLMAVRGADYTQVPTSTITRPSQNRTSEEIFQERRRYFEDSCNILKTTGEKDDGATPLIVLDNLAVCLPPVADVDLIQKLFFYLDEELSFPFFLVDYGSEVRPVMIKHRPVELENTTIKAVVVQHPYFRLFDTYANKLFTPWLLNWRRHGFKIVHLLRHDHFEPDTMEFACGSDVTFAEFIKYIIKSETTETSWSLKGDQHFHPLARQCGLCNSPEDQSMTYDYIIKQETFMEDLEGVLHAAGWTDRLPADFVMDFGYVKAEVTELLRRTFKEHLVQPMSISCANTSETLLRLWRVFQIRGFISLNETFPKAEAEAEAEDANFVQFLNLTMAAVNRSRSDPGLSNNRRAAMMEAYSTVPLDERMALKSFFERDFVLLNYSSTIPEVFPEKDVFTLQELKFFENVFTEGYLKSYEERYAHVLEWET